MKNSEQFEYEFTSQTPLIDIIKKVNELGLKGYRILETYPSPIYFDPFSKSNVIWFESQVELAKEFK